MNGKKHGEGFIEFLKEQGVISLAVALVIGTAAAALINSLINNVIMPPIGLMLGSSDGLRGLTWDMGVTRSGTHAMMHYGQFINDFINFLVIAFVVYIILKWLKGKAVK